MSCLVTVSTATGLPWSLSSKDLPANVADAGLIPGSRSPLQKEIQPTAVFLPGKSHGQREEPGMLQSIGLQRVRHD